tara:strand:+ start:413 stop:1015 length:603 start_codon:yes stop_codon:yes gene_type:complete
MFSKVLNKKFRTSKNFKILKLNLSNQKITKDGQYVNKLKTRKRATIAKGCELMQSQGMLEVPSNKQTTQKMSHDFLHSIGYTVTISEQNFSLVDSQTIDSPFGNFLINNVQVIEDMEISLLDLTKSFPNQFDPIYIADEQEPTSLQHHVFNMTQEEAEKLDLVNIAQDFSATAIVNTPPTATSRYFNNEQIKIGLKETQR